MTNASGFFSPAERDQINSAVAAAEQQTAGEIVPVIATTSDRYEQAVVLGGFLFSVLLLVAAWAVSEYLNQVGGGWEDDPLIPSLSWIVALVIAGFVVGSAVVSYVDPLRYLLSTASDRREQVERRAWEAFGRLGVGKTCGGTGIILYVSLFERIVSVQGDASIAQKLDQKTWEEVRDLIIQGIRDDRAADGFCRAIARCGELLAAHFPRTADDVNELPDELHVLE